jgi:hypothetical protein
MMNDGGTQALNLIADELEEPEHLPEEEVLRGNPFGPSWFRSFMRRHKDELAFVAPRPLERVRREVEVEHLEQFYEQLDRIIREYNIPARLMANFDETMMKALSRTVKVVARRGYDRPTVPIDDKVVHITLGCCVFADGHSLLPIAILDRKYVPGNVSDHVKAGFHWASQKSGWITSKIFHEWITDVFIPHINEERFAHGLQGRFALLLVDGHSSRANPDMLAECKRNKIIVITYVSHSSAMCQVLDRGVFLAFKTSLTARKSSKSFSNAVEYRNELLRHSLLAWREATSPGTILDAWEESGCWPVDKSKAINLRNYPGLDLPTPAPTPAPKRSRAGFKISNRIMTSDQVIAELQEQKKASQ